MAKFFNDYKSWQNCQKPWHVVTVHPQYYAAILAKTTLPPWRNCRKKFWQNTYTFLISTSGQVSSADVQTSDASLSHSTRDRFNSCQNCSHQLSQVTSCLGKLPLLGQQEPCQRHAVSVDACTSTRHFVRCVFRLITDTSKRQEDGDLNGKLHLDVASSGGGHMPVLRPCPASKDLDSLIGCSSAA